MNEAVRPPDMEHLEGRKDKNTAHTIARSVALLTLEP